MKTFAATLAIALAVSLCTIAADDALAAAFYAAPAAQRAEQPVVAPTEPAVPSDAGLSALAIVFISVGGTLALTGGIAYSARWVIHHGHGPAAA